MKNNITKRRNLYKIAYKIEDFGKIIFWTIYL